MLPRSGPTQKHGVSDGLQAGYRYRTSTPPLFPLPRVGMFWRSQRPESLGYCCSPLQQAHIPTSSVRQPWTEPRYATQETTRTRHGRAGDKVTLCLETAGGGTDLNGQVHLFLFSRPCRAFAAKPPTTWCRTRRGALRRGRQRLSGRGLQRPLHHSAVTPSFGRTRESRSRFLLASRCLVK